MRAKFFFAGRKSLLRRDSGGRILLGDNTDGDAVLQRPIMFQVRDFSLFHNVQTGRTPPPIQWDSFLPVKRLGSTVNHSPISSTEIMNQWSYTSTICFHDAGRENFTFYLYFP
jgi:hypothetical protein